MNDFDYRWGILSPNDPSKRPLGYHTKDQADYMAAHMNSIIDRYDDPSDTTWNKDHWKTKPEPFVVIAL